MIEAPAGMDLWDVMGDAVVITTNGDVNREGRAVMGRGCALEAKRLFTDIDKALGRQLRRYGNRVQVVDPAPLRYTPPIVTFPVKHHWHEQADLKLIARSAHELVALTDAEGWETVVMPRPGCGNGRLRWSDVKPILEPLLDDRFVIVHK